MKYCLTIVACIFFSGFVLSVCSFRVFSGAIDPLRIESGLIAGVKSEHSDVIAYKGIPFATPPVGFLRWREPQPVKPWPGIKNCDAFAASPMQSNPVPFGVYTPEFLIPAKPISEDCLYLNVWTRAGRGARMPVFVWIYGGGFSSGGTSVPIYDGEAMAKKGIVFVSANYRVGVFGFLAHPELTKESSHHASGNYGLLDQIAALQWIRKNIDAFGGDPDNVTIAGQSAGSMSVNCLIASPAARGLFNKAIAESGSMFNTKSPALPAAEKQGMDLAASVHALSMETLRQVPADSLMKFQGRFMPDIDGYVLPASVKDIFAAGKQNRVPVLIGWNADESFVAKFQSKELFTSEARKKYGADADRFLNYFPSSTEAESMRSQMKISRDLLFAASGFQWANEQSAEGKVPVYVYYFSRKLPATADFTKYGAFHTGEVAYVMNNLRFLHRPWEAADQSLAELMNNYWIRFISYSDPNGGHLPEWPAYNRKNAEVMVFDKSSGKQVLPDKSELEFLLSKSGK